MRKNKITLLFIVGFTLLCCQSKYDLKSDKHLTEVFTDNEIVEIQKMISYVDNRVVELTGNRDINEAYHQLLNQVDKSMHENLDYFVPFNEEEKYKFLESLDPKVFSEFWTMDNHVRTAIYKDSIYENLDNYKILDLSRSGRYVDYLEKIGGEDAYYKSVKESLEAAGAFTASIAASFLKIHNELDFTIPKNRLWAAIYILRIEEHHDKKMERYLNQ